MLQKLKSLASDTFIYGFSTIFGRFLSFILTPLYTNFLSTSEYDFVIYTFVIIAIMNVIYSFGMDSAYLRFFSSDNKAESDKVFTFAFLSINFVSLIFSGTIFIFADRFAALYANPAILNAGNLVRMAALIPFFDAMTFVPSSYLRMNRKAKLFAGIKFGGIFIAVVLNFLFLTGFSFQGSGVILAQVIASFAQVLVFVPIIIKSLSKHLNLNMLKQMLKYGLPTIPASISAILLQLADRPILKALTHSEIAITTYQVNYRLGIPMMIFVTVFEYAWKPFYLSYHTEEDAKKMFARVFTYFTLFSSLIFLFFCFFMEFFVQFPFVGGKLINPKYWNGMSIIPIVLAAYYFNGMFSNFSAGFLIQKKTKYLPLAVVTAALINIAANFLLIPYFGYVGAAWATFIAYFISALILYFLSRKIYPINYEWKRVILIISITFLLFVLIGFIPTKLNLFYNFMIKSTAFLMFAILLKIFGFFNPEELNFIKRILRKK
jgi:O-antigen/teichoic acid export membrane protein